jgi:formylglycine-generating enzyme required for sulfatase activity
MGAADDVGGPEERPAHEVCVRDFYVGKYEVTQAAWRKVMGNSPASNAACGDDCPVETVSWNDAQAFLARLNAASEGKDLPRGVYRLPTEAEWEYAARGGGRGDAYSGSSSVADVGWFLENTFSIQRVGTKAPNALGIHDMSGNVWEWTNDWYGATYYASSPRKNPTGPSTGERRVLRGGGYGNEPFDLRVSYRNFLPPDYRSGSKGFRVLRGAPVEVK